MLDLFLFLLPPLLHVNGEDQRRSEPQRERRQPQTLTLQRSPRVPVLKAPFLPPPPSSSSSSSSSDSSSDTDEDDDEAVTSGWSYTVRGVYNDDESDEEDQEEEALIEGPEEGPDEDEEGEDSSEESSSDENEDPLGVPPPIPELDLFNDGDESMRGEEESESESDEEHDDVISVPSYPPRPPSPRREVQDESDSGEDADMEEIGAGDVPPVPELDFGSDEEDTDAEGEDEDEGESHADDRAFPLPDDNLGDSIPSSSHSRHTTQRASLSNFRNSTPDHLPPRATPSLFHPSLSPRRRSPSERIAPEPISITSATSTLPSPAPNLRQSRAPCDPLPVSPKPIRASPARTRAAAANEGEEKGPDDGDVSRGHSARSLAVDEDDLGGLEDADGEEEEEEEIIIETSSVTPVWGVGECECSRWERGRRRAGGSETLSATFNSGLGRSDGFGWERRGGGRGGRGGGSGTSYSISSPTGYSFSIPDGLVCE